MYGQVGNSQDRPLDPHQLHLDVAVATPDHQPTRYREIAVEPSVPHPAPVGLNAHLHEAVCALLRDRLHLQARRVGVRAEHGHRAAGFPRRANGEGGEGGCVAGDVVFAAGLEGGPGVSLLCRIWRSVWLSQNDRT